MATRLLGLVPTNSTSREIDAGGSFEGHPFKLILLNISDANKTAGVAISPYSSVLLGPDTRDKLLIVGTNIEWTLAYGDKIWLEIFYDVNLAPVMGIINTGKKWSARVVNPTTPSATGDIVYPRELEFITRYDVTSKIAELSVAINSIDALKNRSLTELLYQKNTGVITSTQYNAVVAAANTRFTEIADALRAHRNSLNSFFAAAPTNLWKKLFRSYTLIGYTTYNLSSVLDGQSIITHPVATAITDPVPQATRNVSFKLVQCLDSDLMLADICYQNRYPAKLPIPYHRAIYDYIHEGNKEDEALTV